MSRLDRRVSVNVLAIVAIAFCAVSSIRAAELDSKDVTSDVVTQPDSQDILLLGPLEPTRMRLRIEVDGQPFRAAWLDMFNRLFDQFDSDRDGRLTPEQASQMASIYGITSGLPGKPAKEMEMQAGGLSREDLKERFEKAAPPLKLTQKLSSGGAGPALAPLLDTDGDGRLSRDELKTAGESLHCRDFNDDQLITDLELVAGPDLSDSSSTGDASANSGSVILLSAGMDPSSVAEILLARYDRNRDGVLSLRAPVEVQSEAGGLSKLDTDGDQLLTRAELRGYLQLPQDVDLPFELGGGGSRRKGTAGSQFQLRGKGDGGYRFEVGTKKVSFARKNRNPKQEENRLRFEDYDADKSSSLDAGEYAGVPDRLDFALVDTNHDEKISNSEFDAIFQQKSKAAAVQILLDATEQGSDLFGKLDKNSDRVLTPRELRSAVDLLETDDEDRDGYLGGNEMLYRLEMEISRGTPRAINNANLALRPLLPPKVKADRSGPSWFLKMDRNRDGDVGLYEFLGNRQTFTRLDADGDGLISATEADAVQQATTAQQPANVQPAEK